MLFRTDTSGTGERQSITRFEEYLVNNYVDDKEAEKQIDSFAFKNVSPNVKAYTDYHIIFYKRTAQTTEETIRNNKIWIPPESLHLADMIFDYSWYSRKFSARSKFSNGKIVDSPDNISVTNVSIDSTQKN
jgi:hypothetical protein